MDSKKVIFISLIICYIGFGVINPILAPLIREMGLEERHAGIVISIAALVLLVTAPVWGRLSDRFGRKRIIVTGFLGFSISLAVFALLGWIGMKGILSLNLVFVLLLFSRVLFGLFFPAITSASQALMADVTTTSERSAGMAIIGAATGIGFIIGPAIGAALSSIHLVFPVIITSILSLCAMVLIIVNIPPTKPTLTKKQIKVNLKQVGLRPYLFIGICLMVMIVMLQITTGFFIQDRFSLDAKETAIWFGIGLFCVGFMMALVQMTIVQKRTLPPHILVRIGLPVFIVSFLILIFIHHLAGFIIAFMLIGAGGGFLMPGYTTGISLAVGEEDQGAAGGLTATATGIGSLLAPVMGTELYRFHPEAPYWTCIFISIFLTIYVFTSHRSLTLQRAKELAN